MQRLSKILEGRLVDEGERREQEGWQLPVSTERDVARAIKSMRSARPVPLGERVARLATIGREARWMPEEAQRLIAERTGSPIRFVRMVTDRLNRWLAAAGDFVATLGEPFADHALRRGGFVYGGGHSTLFVMAGDSCTLPAWSMAHAVIADAPMVIKPSAVEPLSSFLFARALVEQGVASINLLCFNSTLEAERAMLDKLLGSCAQSVVFGEDATVQAIYAPLRSFPAHKAIPYWTGRSGALVLEDADLERAATAVVEGVTEDRGNRCISTKKAFVPRALAKPFEALLVAAAERLQRGDPLAEATAIGRADPASRARAERFAADGEIFYDRDAIFVRCERWAQLLREEIAYPVLAVCYYDPSDDPVALANQTVRDTPSGRALVMSVFTRDGERFERAAHALHAFKVARDRATTATDLLLGHQGAHLAVELMRPRVVAA